MEAQQKVSLYDYLGKAAGPQLGKLVYERAKVQKVEVESRPLQTKTYTGKVLLYPKEFLEEYFKNHKK